MKLSLDSLQNKHLWKGYKLPGYDVLKMREITQKRPIWLHFGAGNMFRAFPAVLAQRLIRQGDMDTGVITCESYDDEIVEKCFHPSDNLSIAVTLLPDGQVDKEIVASLAETLTMNHDAKRVEEIFCSPTLQIVTFTVTEKGYALKTPDNAWLPDVLADIKTGPKHCKSFMGQLTSLCFKRLRSCNTPLALSSLDNCAPNGEKLKASVQLIAEQWVERSFISADEYFQLKQEISFPTSMIDKITPRPSPLVAKLLSADGVEDVHPFMTAKKTYIAPFVNAEKPQYLVIEDDFPNGRPPFEKIGVIFTDRSTVDKVEQMKVCTCLNPPQTALAILGCLLGFTSISDEMKDPDLSRLVHLLCLKEGMPVVVDPGVISAQDFVAEVLQDRLVNPYIPDTPQRIATDTSQKLAIRFGYTIRQYEKQGKVDCLKIIPLVLAAWLRYLIAVDDCGFQFECSPDPLLSYLQAELSEYHLGTPIKSNKKIKDLLSNVAIFGCNLIELGMGESILNLWHEMMRGKGAVRSVLHQQIEEN